MEHLCGMIRPAESEKRKNREREKENAKRNVCDLRGVSLSLSLCLCASPQHFREAAVLVTECWGRTSVSSLVFLFSSSAKNRECWWGRKKEKPFPGNWPAAAMRSIFDCAGQFQGMKELTFLYILFMIGPTLLSVPWFLIKFLRVGPIYKKEWKESPVQRIVANARNVLDLRAATYSSMDRKLVTRCHRLRLVLSLGDDATAWRSKTFHAGRTSQDSLFLFLHLLHILASYLFLFFVLYWPVWGDEKRKRKLW